MHIKETEVKNWDLEVQAMLLKMALGIERVAAVAGSFSLRVLWD